MVVFVLVAVVVVVFLVRAQLSDDVTAPTARPNLDKPLHVRRRGPIPNKIP